MVSNFALLLSQDGIRLAHRTAEGWQEVGRVSLTAEDMAGELMALRKAGEARQGGAFSTKIVLPEDQVKYLSLPTPTDDEERTETIHAALERATPYMVEELAFDWEESDEGLNIAVVARDTLAEAEQFAVQFGFNPLGFVASPDDAQFSVEPFFGPTEAAEHILGKGGEVEAELDKVVLITPPAPDTPEPEWDDPEPEPDIDLPTDDAVVPSFPDDEDLPAEIITARALRAEREVDSGPLPKIGPAGGTETGFAGGRRALDDPELARTDRPGWAHSLRAEKAQAADEAVDSKEVGWLHTDEATGEAEEDAPPAWMQDAPAAPSATPFAAQAGDAADPLAKSTLFQDPEPSRNRWLIPALLLIAFIVIAGGLFAVGSWMFGGSDPQIAATSEAEQLVATESAAPDLQSEVAEITDGSPEQTTAELTGSEADVEPALSDLPVLPDADETTETSVSTDTEPPAIRPAPELQSDVAEVRPAELPDSTVALAADPSTTDEEPALSPTTQLPDAGSDALVPLAASTTPPEFRPTAEEAAELEVTHEAVISDPLAFGSKDEISYAATGVWPVAPVAPLPPTGGTAGSLYITARDPDLRVTDAVALPSEAAMVPDQALATVPNPPLLGQSFARDARGLVQATAQGAMTPDGVLVFAGPPPVVPPLAPNRTAETQTADPQAQNLAGRIPQFRPAEVEAAFADPALRGKIPRLRPATIVERAEQERILAENPLALTETPAPSLRPSNMAAIVAATEKAEIAAQTVRPTAPSAANVSQAATQQDAIPLREINLIGVYGSPGNRRALIRQANGRFQMVVVGDRVDGGSVTAIEASKLYYTKGGTSYVLEIAGN